MIELWASLTIGAVVTSLVAILLAERFAASGFPLPSSDRRIGCVDGLRGFLALSVMVHHFYIWTQVSRLGGSWSPPAIHFLNQLGAGGVALFFMTTGLVFYPRVLAGWRRTSWSMVYVTRLFRIVPLVMLSLGLVTAIVMLRTGATPGRYYPGAAMRWISTWSEPPLLAYPDSGRINAYVLWSLKYEWIFYVLILPASAVVMDLLTSRRFPSCAFPTGLLCCSLVARVAASRLGQSIDLIKYVPLFAIGMLAFECQAKPTIVAALSRPIVGVVAVAALVVGMATTAQPYTWSLPLFGFFFTCVACGNSLGGLLRLRGVLVLGELSFGIYLLHGIVLDIVFVDAHAARSRLATAALPMLLPVAAVVVVLLASATYLTTEKPAMRFGRSLSRRLTGRRATLDSREVEIAP